MREYEASVKWWSDWMREHWPQAETWVVTNGAQVATPMPSWPCARLCWQTPSGFGWVEVPYESESAKLDEYQRGQRAEIQRMMDEVGGV